jgi:hypothetical protein
MKAEEDKDLHVQKAESAHERMKADRIPAYTLYTTFNLQQTVPTPHLNTYYRQLWTHNLVIQQSSGSYMATWSEDTAGCGCFAVISCTDVYLNSVKAILF